MLLVLRWPIFLEQATIFDQVLRVLEEIQVLSEDGADAESLRQALLPLGKEFQIFSG
jgi:hypothetical protein